MTDNNNLIVYCEYEDGKVADVSLELLTKGRVLADKLGVKLEALVIGDKLDKIEETLYPYGVDTVYKVEDARLYPYTSNPHASVLINLFKEIKPQICLMGATCIGRDLGPRVSSCLHSGLTADCVADDALCILHGHLAGSLDEQYSAYCYGEEEYELDDEHYKTAFRTG